MKVPKQIIWNQRFDFGVPLEDIFPSGDIHPRLKFLFEKSIELAVDSGLNLEQILRNQESLKTRLHLKEMIIFEVNYEKIDKFLPGTFLWVIRHFLGLLPIPLFPKYSNHVKYDWNKLSDQCQDYLKYGRMFQEDSYMLDYIIVELLSLIPWEHLFLLNYLIMFMRKITRIFAKNLHQRKMLLLTITKYFCGSVFTRPYKPGHAEKNMLPLLVYLIVKWHEIQDVLADIGIVFEYNDSIIERGNLKDEEVRSLPLKFSYGNTSIDDNTSSSVTLSSQENSTQTDILNFFNKSIQTSARDHDINESTIVKVQNKSSQTHRALKMNRSSQTTVQNFEENSSNTNNENNINKACPLANSTAILPDGDVSDTFQSANQNDYSYFTAAEYTSKYYSIVNTNESINHNTNQKDETENCIEDFTPRGKESELLDETPYSFFSVMDTTNEWSNILKETSKTVKKMDGYIYDDYDTFAKEEFNQLFDENQVQISQESKRLKWKNNPFRNNGNKKNNTMENSKENSYVRFENIDDILVFNSSTGSIHEISTQDNNSDPLVRSSFSSDDKLYSPGKNSVYKETKSKIYFGLKRFKTKINFFRLLTNKNVSNKSMVNTYFNNPKYERMRHIKANTL